MLGVQAGVYCQCLSDRKWLTSVEVKKKKNDRKKMHARNFAEFLLDVTAEGMMKIGNVKNT